MVSTEHKRRVLGFLAAASKAAIYPRVFIHRGRVMHQVSANAEPTALSVAAAQELLLGEPA